MLHRDSNYCEQTIGDCKGRDLFTSSPPPPLNNIFKTIVFIYTIKNVSVLGRFVTKLPSLKSLQAPANGRDANTGSNDTIQQCCGNWWFVVFDKRFPNSDFICVIHYCFSQCRKLLTNWSLDLLMSWNSRNHQQCVISPHVYQIHVKIEVSVVFKVLVIPVDVNLVGVARIAKKIITNVN